MEWLPYAFVIVGMILLIFVLVSVIMLLLSGQDVIGRGFPGNVVCTCLLCAGLVVLCVFYGKALERPLTTEGALPYLAAAVALLLSLLLLRGVVLSLKQRSAEIVTLIMGVMESGDPSLHGHSSNLASLSTLIYDFLPLNRRLKISRWDLYYAAILMDLGKYRIPASIRNKSGKLSEEEQRLMKSYPEVGVEVMKKLPSFHRILDWILYRRERFDGSGYYHLQGEQIPLASRILAIADAFAAMTTPRPYRPSLSYEMAVEELKISSGTQFDPEIVRNFCEIPLNTVSACIKNDEYSMSSDLGLTKEEG